MKKLLVDQVLNLNPRPIVVDKIGGLSKEEFDQKINKCKVCGKKPKLAKANYPDFMKTKDLYIKCVPSCEMFMTTFDVCEEIELVEKRELEDLINRWNKKN